MSTATISASPLQPRARMDYIDALRGAACLWVLLRHSLGLFPTPEGLSRLPLSLLVKFSQIGWLGVSLFLVLSGFCLYYPLARRAQSLSEIRLELRPFANRRAWRILPPFYAAFMFYSAAKIFTAWRAGRPLFGEFEGWLDFASHLTMTHNLFASTFGSVNAAFWSLALESQLYLIFPLLVVLAARRGLKTILAVTFLISVGWQLLCFSRLGLVALWTPEVAVWYDALPGRCFEFAVGMSAAATVARPIGKSTLRACAIAAGLLLLPALYYVSEMAMFGPLINQIWSVIFGCALILLHQLPEARFRSNLALKALTWTGVISYSLYLMHNFIFKLVRLPATDGSLLSDSKLIAFVFARMALAVVIAYGFFWLFERPFIKTRRKTKDLIEATVLSPAP